jgi:serine/threonine protein kinase
MPHLRQSDQGICMARLLQFLLRTRCSLSEFNCYANLTSVKSYVGRGMAYLHNEPNVIIHRDLKPRLVDSVSDLLLYSLCCTGNR